MSINSLRVTQNISIDPQLESLKGINYNIPFRMETLSVDEMIEKIKAGHYWAATFNHYIFSKKAFVGTYCIVFHIRHLFTMNEYIKKLEEGDMPLPTFAYEVGKSKTNDNVFKLVYVFDKEIGADDFAMVYNNLSEAIGYAQENNTKPGNMMIMKHCGCKNGSVYRNNVIYNKDEFLVKEDSLFDNFFPY